MWNFWITVVVISTLLLQLMAESDLSISFLDSRELSKKINLSNFTLIGYLKESQCNYTDYFLQQLKILEFELKDTDIEIALTYEPLGVKMNEPENHNYPLLVLHRGQTKEKIPITWAHEGKNIAHWVKSKFQLNSTLEIHTVDEYYLMLERYRTVFSAHLNDKNIDIYRKISDEVNAIFLEIRDQHIAKIIMGDEGQWIVVENFETSTGRKPQKCLDIDNPTRLRKWAYEQLRRPIKEINDKKANIAFGSDNFHNFAILFTSTASSDFTRKMNTFVKMSNDAKNLVLYYVNVENDDSQELVRYFNVSKNELTIVLIEGIDQLYDQFFTKRCSTRSLELPNILKRFKTLNEIDKYNEAASKL